MKVRMVDSRCYYNVRGMDGGYDIKLYREKRCNTLMFVYE